MSHEKFSLIVVTVFVLMLAAVIAGGCVSSTVAPSGDIKKFGSADEIRDYIKNNTQLIQDENYRTDGGWAPVPVPVMAAQESSAKGVSSSGILPSAGGLGSPG